MKKCETYRLPFGEVECATGAVSSLPVDLYLLPAGTTWLFCEPRSQMDRPKAFSTDTITAIVGRAPTPEHAFNTVERAATDT